ncbi:MAG: histidinol-phosphate transaminase, partial [Cyanobacteria bacterium P01_C01_bin.73]
FSMYKILAQTLGIPVVTVPRQPETFEIDIDAAQSAIAAPGEPPVRLVFMVHPNSPTGNALTTNELAWLRTLPPDVLVVIDEAYFEFSQQTTVATVLEQPNWIVTRTFSKAFSLAAHRVGYAVAQPDAIAVLEKVRLPYNLPSFSQAAALIALYHRQTLLQRVPGLLAERDRLFDALQTHPNFQVWPSAANFIYGRVAPLADATDSNLSQLLFQQLKAQGTLIRYTGGGLRITVGTPEENTRTCDRLLSCLNHLA